MQCGFAARAPSAHTDRTEGQPEGDRKGMLDRESRQVRAMVVPNVKRETLQAKILDEIERGSTVHTDGYPAYHHLTAQDYIHARREPCRRICSRSDSL